MPDSERAGDELHGHSVLLIAEDGPGVRGPGRGVSSMDRSMRA